ncbi:MAG TPA: hypothetical protein VMV50_01730 [Candidatus Paceibacterota bacterium]|nr:hypothetical protein [Candidatus Paceibacterota bacterium]
MGLIVPAVLPSSRKDLEERLALFSRMLPVDRVQVDVVDGRFASPASWPYASPGEMSRMRSRGETLPQLDRVAYEADLMCLDPLAAAEDWLALGATRLTFHAETADDPAALLAAAKARFGGGADFIDTHFVSFGLALDLATDPARVEPCLGAISYIQFMGIATIGRQGEPFDARVLERVKAFREKHPDVPVQVDGGVSLTTAKPLLALGVANLVVGSAILDAPDPLAVLKGLEGLSSPYGV